MAENFEEQFLMYLIPYAATGAFYDTDGNLKVPPNIPNADQWMQSVRNDLMLVNGTRVGKIILNAIKSFGIVVYITPMTPGKCNAGVQVEEIIRKRVSGMTTGVQLAISPENHAIGSKCETRRFIPRSFHIASHEVLLHELVHVFREVSTMRNRTDTGKGLLNYTNNEEFNAILVQGIYASERKTPIRGSHQGHFEIDKNLNGSYKFFKSGTETYDLVKRFCRENPKTTRALSKINVPFNPLKAFYENRALTKQLSHGQMAHSRDLAVPGVRALKDLFESIYK